MSGKAKPAPGGPGSFETALARLDEIVRRLEATDLGLEESLKLFEEGTRIARELGATLDRADRTIEVLRQDSAGDTRIEPFEPQSDDTET